MRYLNFCILLLIRVDMKGFRVLSCVVGVFVSLYAMHVEHMNSIDTDYVASCDLSATMSCSKVLSSEYGHLFSHIGLLPKDSVLDQSNAFYGLIFYCIVGLLAVQASRSTAMVRLNTVLAVTGVVFSLVLAYILKFVLEDFCVVCVTTYVCNTVIFVDSMIEYASSAKATAKSKGC